MAAKKKVAKKQVVKKQAAVKKQAKKKAAPSESPRGKKQQGTAQKSISPQLLSAAEARAAEQPSEVAEQNPNTPAAQLLAYARRIAELALPAKAGLVALKDFKEAWVVQLLPLAELLADADAKWAAARARSRAGVSPAQVKEAEALKDELVEAIRYLLRNNPEVQQEVDQILEGTGVADLALDLNRLAHIVEAYLDDLVSQIPEDAGQKARTFSATLGTGITPENASDLQARRNRLFHLLDGDVSEVVAALRFLWRKQPTKLALIGVRYASQLRRDLRARKKKKETFRADQDNPS